VLDLDDTLAPPGQPADIARLRRVASIELALVAAYDLVLAGAGAGAGAPRRQLVANRSHHVEHQRSVDALTVAIGGAVERRTDPGLARRIGRDRTRLGSPGPALELLAELETVAAATYVLEAGGPAGRRVRLLAASIMGVEAQHATVLSTVKTLLDAGGEAFTALPPPVVRLPFAAGRVGLNHAFYPTGAAATPAR
jgi:hypothetical protein